MNSQTTELVLQIEVVDSEKLLQYARQRATEQGRDPNNLTLADAAYLALVAHAPVGGPEAIGCRIVGHREYVDPYSPERGKEIFEELRDAVRSVCPDAAFVHFVADEHENGFFYTDNPTIRLRDGRDVLWDDVAGFDAGGYSPLNSITADLTDYKGPIGARSELVVDLDTLTSVHPRLYLAKNGS